MKTNSRNVIIEWGDCDPAGIVFYPRYFAMFDASTAFLFASVGLKKIDLLAKYNAVGFPMVDTRSKFKIPSKYGDEIRIETHVSEFRNSSFDIIHQVFKGHKLAIEAWETRVWAVRDPNNPDKIIPALIPKEVKEKLS